MAQKEIQLNIQISEVSNKCLRLINKTTTNIAFIHNAVLNIDTITFPPLQTDGLPITIDDPNENALNISPKEKALDWLLKKAFEEFILGLTESLIEAYKVVKLKTFSIKTKTQTFTVDQINEEIEKISKKPLELPFPKLIDEIEAELKKRLNLSDEIKSINQVRNCLVHDNGIVSDKRINDKENNCLNLKYIELVVISEKDGKIIEVKLQDKKDGFTTNKIGFETRQSIISFPKGGHVKIDQNLFNCISYTCIQFVFGLLDSMPKPDK